MTPEHGTARRMHVSGVGVIARDRQLEEAAAAIAELPGAEVFALDRASSRLVVVQDLPSVAEHMDGLRRIQALPQVLVAELHYHWSDAADRGAD